MQKIIDYELSEFQQDKLAKLEQAISDFMSVTTNVNPEIKQFRRAIQRAIDDYNLDTP